MSDYDASRHPSPAWEALDPAAQIERVQAHHARLGGRHAVQGGALMHLRLHVTVEAQRSAGHPAVLRLFRRFEEAGIVRHEIVHAAGTTFAEAMQRALAEGAADADALYSSALDALTPSDWLARVVRPRVGTP